MSLIKHAIIYYIIQDGIFPKHKRQYKYCNYYYYYIIFM